MTPTMTFHVPPEAGPSAMRALLAVLDGSEEGAVFRRTELMQAMTPYLETNPRSEVLTLASGLGIIAQVKEGFSANLRARALARIGCGVDLIHGLQYFAWSPQDPAVLSPSWTYRTLVDSLYDHAPVSLDSQLKNWLIEDVLDRARREFQRVPGFDASRISIGPKSIDGVIRWLAALSPSVMRGGVLRRRDACPPQLLALAIGAVARRAGAADDTDFRLTPDHRSTLYRSAFIEPECLDRMLDWTVATHPTHLRWGTAISTYGRQLVVPSAIAPEDLA